MGVEEMTSEDIIKVLIEKNNILEQENEKLKIMNAKQEQVIKSIYETLKRNALL